MTPNQFQYQLERDIAILWGCMPSGEAARPRMEPTPIHAVCGACGAIYGDHCHLRGECPNPIDERGQPPFLKTVFRPLMPVSVEVKLATIRLDSQGRPTGEAVEG